MGRKFFFNNVGQSHNYKITYFPLLDILPCTKYFPLCLTIVQHNLHKNLGQWFTQIHYLLLLDNYLPNLCLECLGCFIYRKKYKKGTKLYILRFICRSVFELIMSNKYKGWPKRRFIFPSSKTPWEYPIHIGNKIFKNKNG